MKGRFEEKHKSFISVRKLSFLEKEYKKCHNCKSGKVGKTRVSTCGYCGGTSIRKIQEAEIIV